MNCRHCNELLSRKFLDLGFSPPSNAYLSVGDLSKTESYLPLRVWVCSSCWLVQTEDFETPDRIFDENYAYFSSTSRSWLEHAEKYTEMIVKRLQLNESSLVMEIASNDGYLLKNFAHLGIPNFGVEPTESTAGFAEGIGICTDREFFGEKYALDLASGQAPYNKSFSGERGALCDLIVGNNVFAHVPDINDFTLGLKLALKSRGTITLEFPHLERLVTEAQFDTVYHEHFSYLSLHAVQSIFADHGLRVYDVDKLPTHGGSLRIYGCHDHDERLVAPSVNEILLEERSAGLLGSTAYDNFQHRADEIKNSFLNFLLEAKRDGKVVCAYGAAAKGNTLLNYAGVKPDLIEAVFDGAVAKQGNFLPGSHIPILNPAELYTIKPDYLVILPWNLKHEISNLCEPIRGWGGKFVVTMPSLEVF